MAKRHIKVLARQLVDKYSEVDKQLQSAGIALQDSMLSPEEQSTFSIRKAEIDNQLSLLSVALSAAAQGKIAELLNQVKQEREAFQKPLEQLVDDLSGDLPEELRQSSLNLVAMYTEKIKSNIATLFTISRVQFFANLPNSHKVMKAKCKLPLQVYSNEYPNGLSTYVDVSPCNSSLSLKKKEDELYSELSPLYSLDMPLKEFTDYVEEFKAAENLSSAGDLDE